MNAVYNNNLGKEKITGGIVGIWAKMCMDSLLMRKLFEKGQNLARVPMTPAFTSHGTLSRFFVTV
jgi:hypothetical protein